MRAVAVLALLAAACGVAAQDKAGVVRLSAVFGDVPVEEREEALEVPLADKQQGGNGDQYDTSTLRLLHVIFRHGQRTPADTYPNDPYVNFNFAPVGWGQLTLEGKRDQYEQGQWMRRRYGSFLGDLYHPDVVEVRSTDVPRTQMSAMLAMAGLWPPAPEQRWNPRLDWQPVAVKSQSLDQDDLLLVRVPCARYGEMLEEVMQSPPVVALLKENEPLLRYLTEKTGMKIATPDDVQSLYSTLKAEEGFHLALPDWANGTVYPDAMTLLTALSFEINVMTREMQRIKGGPLVKAVMKHSVDRANGDLKAERRMYAYAGHDSTVANFLIAMGAWDTQIPGYGILALVELHEDPASHEYGLKMFLRNSTEVPPYPLHIQGCGHFCPLERLAQLTADVVPDSLQRVCVPKDPNYTPPPASGP